MGSIIAASALILGIGAYAQVAQDHPTYKGDNGRQGKNPDPSHNSPGQTNLRWATPSTLVTSNLTAPIIDNTDSGQNAPDGHPYDVPNGIVTSTGTWLGPADGNEASPAYVPLTRQRAVPSDPTAPRNFAPRSPAYAYAACTPSSLSSISDPRVPQNAGSLATWTWSMTGVDTTPRPYAVYVNIPSGSQTINGKAVFPQRWYVFEVSYGADNNPKTKELALVDTYNSGTGFIRLGNNGLSTDKLYPYDGVHPIKVTLYNTVPRNSDGSLTMRAPTGSANQDVSQFVVYADAAKFVPNNGSYTSTSSSMQLDSANQGSGHVTEAKNVPAVSTINGTTTTVYSGVVTDHLVDADGTKTWQYSPNAEGAIPLTLDSGGIGNGFAPTPVAHAVGTDAQTALIVSGNATASTTYNSGTTLGDQTYDVYVYIPGNYTDTANAANNRFYGHAVNYLVTDADGDHSFRIDQSVAQGWVHLGNQRFRNQPAVGTTPGIPITVTVFNTSGNGGDANGNTYAYADGIRFVGNQNRTITSSLIHARVNILQQDGTRVLTNVVIVADENGVIHCLDAAGKADGTTTEYWSYPSVRDSGNGADPNLGTDATAGPDYKIDPTNLNPPKVIDRTPTAIMPQSFGLSSGLVQQIGADATTAKYYLVIGSSNGRVYCIDTEGRGDFATRIDSVSGRTLPGTAIRQWTFPDDDGTTTASKLVSVTGSVSSAKDATDTDNTKYTVYIPSTVGRLYAVDLVGDGTNKVTTQKWAFPVESAAHLGPIAMTPSVAFGRVYFGTLRNPATATGTEVEGQFYAINKDTGVVDWSYQSDDDFLAGTAVASNHDLDPTNTDTTAGLVYALNQNRTLYAFNSDGTNGVGTTAWTSTDVQGISTSSLEFLWQTVYNNSGILSTTGAVPVVSVPTSDGRIVSLYAQTGVFNRFGTKVAWSQTLVGDAVNAGLDVQGTTPTTLPASESGTGWLFVGDSAGWFYGFNNQTGFSGGGNAPIAPDIVPNNPAGEVFNKTKVTIISKADYQILRKGTSATTTGAGVDNTYTYNQAKTKMTPVSTANPPAFEWGQTMYVFVYDFPFQVSQLNDASKNIDAPIVNVSMSVNGKTIRGIATQARQFSDPTHSPKWSEVAPNIGTPPTQGDDPVLDGYAVLAFPLQNSGPNSLPPGSGTLSINISSAAFNGIQQNVLTTTTATGTTAGSTFPFNVANPLAIVVPNTNADVPTNPGSTYPNNNDSTTTNKFSFGYTNNPAHMESLLNGVGDINGKLGTRLTAGTKATNHGDVGKVEIWVYDRSMIAATHGDGTGLTGVRLTRRDLGWLGGSNTVYKPLTLDSPLYSSYEQAPVNSPNTSADYPDIHADRVTATKDPDGNAENPLFNGPGGVTLNPPRRADGKTAIDDSVDVKTRVLEPTRFVIEVNVPRFQPPNVGSLNGNNYQVPNSASTTPSIEGYLGRFDVFVDSVANARLDIAQREPYRSFNVSTGVLPDERLSVTTPTVDLGTLSAGTGYEPGIVPGAGFVVGSQQWSANSNVFHPWQNGKYAGVFKTFGVQNEGNVNMLDVRIAKQSDFTNWLSPGKRLNVGSAENDGYSWLDGAVDLWSDIDPNFSVAPNQKMIIQKARVQDLVPSTLQSNPIRRGSTVTVGGVTYQSPINQSVASGTLLYQHNAKFTPVVGVSVPIGMPAGHYQSPVRVYENVNHGSGDTNFWGTWNGSNSTTSPAETYTDPGFLLSFNVSETRLTGSTSSQMPTMIENLGTGTNAAGAPVGNQNVQPAAARDAFGSLVLAWASNRPNSQFGTVPGTADPFRLYVSTLDSAATFTPSHLAAPPGVAVTDPNAESPIRDLNAWNAVSGTQWFNNQIAGFPNAAADPSIFGAGTLSDVRYGNAAFPASGERNPFAAGQFYTGMYLAFTGQAQRRNPDNTVQNESRLLLSVANPSSNGTVSMTGPFVLPDNPQAIKGKPAVIQSGPVNGTASAMVLYPVTVNGASSIMYTRYPDSSPRGTANNKFHPSEALPFGPGFASVSSPSAAGRIYRRSDSSLTSAVIELTFQGKLRGRPYPEIFLGRLNATTSTGLKATVVPTQLPEISDGNGNSHLDQDNAFAWLPEETNENIQPDSQAGTYRSRGVYWNTRARILLRQVAANGTITNLLLDGYAGNDPDHLAGFDATQNTAAYDPDSGIVSYDTRLGGKVYLDPTTGTVRFSSASPSRNVRLQLTYTTRFLRISAGGSAGYYDPTGLYDDRYITDPTFWRLGTTAATLGTFTRGTLITNDRMVFTYNRAAAGGGQGARPFMSSLRFGVRLPYRLPTMPNGVPGVASGNTVQPAIASVQWLDGLAPEAYEIDAAQGRLYFPANAEGRPIRVTFYGADANGNVLPASPFTSDLVISLITETGDTPIPVETSVNESNLISTLDPFQYSNINPFTTPQYRRPPLMWLFWTSTRNGSPDLYFESLAPRWSAVPTGH